MFVNKLNQLYKPYRLLYYYEASPEEIEEFRAGNIPDKIGKYENAFGTIEMKGPRGTYMPPVSDFHGEA